MSTVEEQKILIELETMPFIVGPTDNGQERKQQEFDSMGAKNDRDRPNDTKSVISTLIARKTGIS